MISQQVVETFSASGPVDVRLWMAAKILPEPCGWEKKNPHTKWYGGFHSHGGTQKMDDLFHGNSHCNGWWLGVPPYFRKPPYWSLGMPTNTCRQEDENHAKTLAWNLLLPLVNICLAVKKWYPCNSTAQGFFLILSHDKVRVGLGHNALHLPGLTQTSQSFCPDVLPGFMW